MKKLKLNKTIKPAPRQLQPAKSYKSPIGWWKVTTEGDEEGRSTTDLGTHYGHLAEIAFHLADKVFYTLQFEAIANPPAAPKKYPKYQAKKDIVSVGFAVDSETWDIHSDHKKAWWTNWLNTNEVEVSARNNGAEYYRAVWLHLL